MFPSRAFFIATSLFGIPFANAAIVFPDAAVTQSQIQQCLTSTCSRPVNEGTFQTLTTNNGPNSAFGEVDFTAGTVKASIDNSTNGFSAVSAWEFVSFDIGGGGSTNIGWSMDFNGSLTNPAATSYAYANVYAFIFDVTGDSTYFTQFAPGNGGVIQFATSNNLVSCSVFNGIVRGSGNPFDVGTGACAHDTKDLRVNSDGTPQNFSGTLSDSFTAHDGSLYLVQMVTILNLGTSSGGAADFSHTSTFSFTDLGTSTLQSASGEFLASQTAVPEPGTWLLAGLGLLGVAIRRASFQRR